MHGTCHAFQTSISKYNKYYYTMVTVRSVNREVYTSNAVTFNVIILITCQTNSRNLHLYCYYISVDKLKTSIIASAYNIFIEKYWKQNETLTCTISEYNTRRSCLSCLQLIYKFYGRVLFYVYYFILNIFMYNIACLWVELR